MYRILLPILILVNGTFCQEECVFKAIIEDAWDKKLHKNLLKSYISSSSPNNNTCVSISLYFMLKSFGLDEYDSKFTAKLWTRLKWTDDRLKWSPEDYGGVEKIVMPSRLIWAPTIKLLNSLEDEGYGYYEELKDCVISNDGGILCVPHMVYESYCNAKLKNWPYDIQKCTLQIGSGESDYGYGKFNFSESGRVISLVEAEYGAGWTIMQRHVEINESSVVQLSITLTLERQAYGLVVILVFPCIIVALLTLTAGFLNVTDSVRVGILCFSLICHFLALRGIDTMLPLHTVDTPVILLFIRGSILLTVASILFSYLLKSTMNKKTAPTEQVSSISNKVFDGAGKYFIFPKWEPKTKGEVSSNDGVWMNVANILNSVFMLIVAICYVILFSIYMPKQPPYEYPATH